jgi:hypothetical protein
MFCLIKHLQKSAEIIKEICGCHLITPCTKRCNSLHDSVKKILEKRECLQKLTYTLKLPCFKDVELYFLDEYAQTLAQTAVALDRLHGEKMIYYANLLPVILFAVSSKLNSLQTLNFASMFTTFASCYNWIQFKVCKLS